MKEIYEAKNYSYELNPDMLKLLREEFDVDKVTSKFAEAIKGKSAGEIEAEGKAIFEEYGRNWIRQSLKLGEEYPDRTYEVLLEAIDKTGGYLRFALAPQRFLEIAYLSTQEISILPIIENNVNRLVYRMVDCDTYKNLKEKCGEEVANLLPCRHACLTACETLHRDLEIDALVQMEAQIPKDGYCQFAARRA
ncbi:MAG: hypothetical protein JRG97_13755 [Deltaproteobacteria bacterium]|nr:hypothetical protein [Deltaproteobacteria bacterium]MBW2053569.1 hypothetical protein [Deltaproteobacteria bacterium]MBW2142110.1 hypothetical protein [Deltaproteobacteria bacterium]